MIADQAGKGRGSPINREIRLKVLMLNGSPRKNGTIAPAFHERERVFQEQDAEDLRVMRVLANNMVFLRKSIVLGRQERGLPVPEEPRVWTNFTR